MNKLSSVFVQNEPINNSSNVERPILLEHSLNQIRLTLGYKQQEFAEKLGINVNTYRGYEYQKRDLPEDFLRDLIATFNVNINWLLFGQGEMFVSQTENSLVKCDNNALLKNKETFHKRFNKLQTENQLNDYEMSKLLDISESRIEKLGIGKAEPTFEELCKLKANFDISIDWLLFGETLNKSTQSEETALSADEIAQLKLLAKKFKV